MRQTPLYLPEAAFAWIEPATVPVMTTLARFVFVAVLFMYFINSGMTKLPDGLASLFSPSFNAFAQIFPRGAEAASYDITQASGFQKLVILAGTWAEFILPTLILVGLYTRAAAFGMIGFIVVQSLTDMIGHGAAAGAWFDNLSDAAILDQRAFWVFVLLYLVFRGGGPFSMDRVLFGGRARSEEGLA
ncbi:MAG: DoxX family protein [Pseudomonadota bacterium]